MKRQPILCLLLFCGSVSLLSAEEPIFVPVKIDGPIHNPAEHSYWYGPFCECASVADFDGDGDLDIAAGRNWYEAPDWIKHTDFRNGAQTNGPETDDNSEFAMDVNFDGRPDIVSSGWMFMKGAFWYENPGQKDVRWQERRIHKAYSMEGIIHGDIDGDGDQDILCNHWMPVRGQAMTWLEHIDRAPWFVEHTIGTDGEKHGNGLGDIDGDGHTDIVTPIGWWQAPQELPNGTWTFHADYTFQAGGKPASASHPMLVHDVNEDGHNDIIVGAAHDYGLSVLVQTMDDQGQRGFKQTDIETDFGQFHTMALGDLDGDGRKDLVTGKRLFAHHGRDISCYEPLYAFWYNIHPDRFTRHVLAFNHLPRLLDDQTRRNPPPNFVPSVGMKLNIADMDGDGNNDIVVCGKGGLYIFYRHGSGPQPRPEHRLPHEDTYPSWTDWAKTNGGFTDLFNGTDLDQWTMGPDKSWVVVDGEIRLQREFDGKEHNLDYLWTKQQFGDFALDLEFKIPERANSGIFLRTPNLQDPVFTGIEIQVSNSHGREQWSKNNCAGAAYDLLAPTSNPVYAPGQWNHYLIIAQGPRITVILNGQRILHMDLDQWTTAHQNPDGTENKFGTALKDFARRGHIGLQDHGREVAYRNIRVKRL